MPLRSCQFLTEEGAVAHVHLDFPGPPFVADCGSDGSHVYIHVPFGPDEHVDEAVWGVYRLAWLIEPDRDHYYFEQDESGRLMLDNFRKTRQLWLAAETIEAIADFAALGGYHPATRRGRLSPLAAAC